MKNRDFLKFFSRLLPLAILFVVLHSCSSENNVTESHPPFHYKLKVKVEDTQGVDQVKGIGRSTRTDLPNFESLYFVDYDFYHLETLQSGKEKERLLTHQVSVQETDDDSYLILTTETLPSPDYRPEIITYSVVCPHVFGDKKEHRITTYWDTQAFEESVYLKDQNVCRYVEVDGERFEAVYDANDGSSITIVIVGDTKNE